MATTTIQHNGILTVVETGVFIDGCQMNVGDLNVATAKLADGMLGTTFAETAAEYRTLLDTGTDDEVAHAAMALDEIADDAVAALNEATAEGFYWDVENSDLRLDPEED